MWYGCGMKTYTEQDQRGLAMWAADCAEHVLPLFEQAYPEDKRPRAAIDATRAWVRKQLSIYEAREAAYAAHDAAREAVGFAAQAAARAAGHAAATAHVVTHAPHAAAYARKAAGSPREEVWQTQQMPKQLIAIYENIRTAPARGDADR